MYHNSKNQFFQTLFFCLLAVGLLSSDSFAQSDSTDKRPLNHSDYDLWHRITNQQISADGKWVLYSTRSGKVDAEENLRIRQNGSTKEYRIERGGGARFTFDSKFVVYRISPSKAKLKALKKAKTKSDDLPSPILEVLELKTGERFSANDVKSFNIPQENGRWLAYQFNKELDTQSVKQQSSTVVESYEVTPTGLRKPEKQLKLKKRPVTNSNTSEQKPKKTKTKKSEGEKKSKPEASKSDDKEKEVKKTKTVGTTLVLRDLDSGLQQTFPHVVRYWFSKNGARLAFVTSTQAAESKKKGSKSDSHEKSPEGVYVVDLESLELQQIISGHAEYKNVTFTEDGSQLAFLTNKDDYKRKTSAWALYHWKTRQKMATKIADEESAGIPQNWWVSPVATALFSEDGKRLFFDTAPIPEAVIEERAGKKDEDEEPKAKLDLWHWQDPQLQPQQLLQVARERNRSYRAVYNLRTKKIVQLATQEIPDLRIDFRSKSNVVVANSNMPYRKMLSWDIPGFQDVYLVNLDTGTHETLVKKTKFSGSISPDGKYVTWFDGEQRKWFAVSTGSDRNPVEISKGIKFPLQNELHDTPSLPRAYGAAGWLKDDEAILIYDRYDIWQVDPTGQQKPLNMTRGEGRKNKVRYRYQRLDSEARFIETSEPIYLSAFDETTKASGYSKLTIANDAAENNQLTQLIQLDERVSGISKAKNSDNVIFSRSTFQMCSDIWASTLNFKKIYRISDINPQQDNYLWGRGELISWNATDGQKLDGIIYKPDGFDPDKKYPLMVYFYERNSDNLHRYYTPEAGRSIINHSFYVSRGYVLFIPDIPYKTGEPGPSAANAILPGVEHIVQQGFIDEKKIGMQGHSWGGYQTAYLVTQTDMFACAESGAPVSNMTSAYGGIRWSSGMSRMFQYEKTQSRIGQDLWAARDKYIANSPVFFADKVNTPLLILHNDEDGAVPWYQGIELFVALRRLEKPAWLLNYNQQPHWVMKDENRRDFAIRMQQFFDHYLMDAPEPEWMAYGLPAVDKGKKFALDLMEPVKPESEEKEGSAKTTADK
ncbi:MAG: prolyl oligopeptidase family serine peptidase [Mariniblastus sp.]|nr:prolyl oligopeptidase family serine peptidase [Mariniblastus sp.]